MDTSSTDDGSVSCNRHDVCFLFPEVEGVEAREIEGEEDKTRARSVLWLERVVSVHLAPMNFSLRCSLGLR